MLYVPYVGRELMRHGSAPVLIPLSIPGLSGWYDASAIASLYQDAAGTVPVSADGDPVGRASDLSGNGNHLTQSTTALKPTYKVGIENGLAVLRGDGGDYMSANLAASSARTMIGIFKIHAASNNARLIAYSPNNAIYDQGTGTWSYTTGGPYYFGNPNIFLSLCLRFSSADLLTVYVNGSAAGTSNPNNDYSTSTLLTLFYGGGFPMYGDCGELLEYGEDIGGDNIAMLHNEYLAPKWGL